MTGFVMIGCPVALILTAVLPKRWQRLLAAGVTVTMGVGFLQVATNEVTKSVWAQSRSRVEDPTRRVLTELRDYSNTGKTAEATALATYMVNNWHLIGLAPWQKTVGDVRAGLPEPRVDTRGEQSTGADPAWPGPAQP